MTDMTLSIRLTADGAELIGVTRQGEEALNKLGQAEEGVGKAGKQAGDGVDKLKQKSEGLDHTARNVIRTLVTAAAATISWHKALEYVDAYRKQESAVQKLDASIKSMGRTTSGLSIQLQGLARQIQREGVIPDEAIIEGQSFLTTYSQISDDVLPRATRVMVDLAAKMGGDVVSAANMVGKASMGMTGELSRIGITLSEDAKESKDFGLILRDMESQVAGTNKAVAEGGGYLEQLSNRLGDSKEKVGDLIATNKDVRKFADDFVSGVESMIDSLKEYNDKLLTAEELSKRLAKSSTMEDLKSQEAYLLDALDKKSKAFSQRSSLSQIISTLVPTLTPFSSDSGELSNLYKQLQAVLLAEKLLKDAAAGGGAGGGPPAPDNYAQVKASLEKQIALYGQVSNAAQMRYELEEGSLKMLDDKYKKQLMQLAQQLDAKDRDKQATKDQADAEDELIQLTDRLADDQRKQMEQRDKLRKEGLSNLEQSLMTETELENRRYQESIKLLEEAERKKLATTMSYEELRTRIEQDHQKKLMEIQDKATEDTRKKLEQAARQQAELFQRPFKNAIDSMQSSLSDFYQKAFTGGIHSFSDLASSIKDIFIRLAAEIAALLTFRPIVGSVISAVGGSALASSLGLASGGIGGVGGTGLSIPMPGLGSLGGIGSTINAWAASTSLFGTGAGATMTMPSGLIANLPGATGILGGTASLTSVLGAGGIGALGGGLLTSLLGLNQTGGSIGGGIGAAIGTMTPLGPIGGLIGGALGSLIGGLFGNNKPSNMAQGVQINPGGQLSSFGMTGDKFNQQVRTAVDGIGQELQRSLTAITQETGATLSKAVSVYLGQRDPTYIEVGGHSQNLSNTIARSTTGDSSAAFNAAIKAMLANLSGGDSKLIQTLRTTFNQTGDINKALAAVQQKQQDSQSSDLLKQQRTQIEATLKAQLAADPELAQLELRYKNLREQYKQYGVDLTLLDKLEQQDKNNIIAARKKEAEAMQKQKTAFADQIDLMVSSMPALDQLNKQFRDLRDQADQLGYSVGRINQAQVLALQQMQDDVTSKIRDMVNNVHQALGTDALINFQQQLSYGDLSPLSAKDRLSAAYSELQKLKQAAAGGDTTAIQSLPGIEQTVLTLARDVYASGPKYQAIEREIVKINDNQIAINNSLEKSFIEPLAGIDITIKQTSQDQVAAIRKQTTDLIKELKAVKQQLKELRAA